MRSSATLTHCTCRGATGHEHVMITVGEEERRFGGTAFALLLVRVRYQGEVRIAQVECQLSSGGM